ncbi:hypothetical protein AZZ82_000160 [Klebsiella aerogenes]|nr:hypothetical protein AZZ82_000160 [Klebsiella aerogenes]
MQGLYLTSVGCVNLWSKFEMHLTIYPLPGIQYYLMILVIYII